MLQATTEAAPSCGTKFTEIKKQAWTQRNLENFVGFSASALCRFLTLSWLWRRRKWIHLRYELITGPKRKAVGELSWGESRRRACTPDPSLLSECMDWVWCIERLLFSPGNLLESLWFFFSSWIIGPQGLILWKNALDFENERKRGRFSLRDNAYLSIGESQVCSGGLQFSSILFRSSIEHQGSSATWVVQCSGASKALPGEAEFPPRWHLLMFGGPCGAKDWIGVAAYKTCSLISVLFFLLPHFLTLPFLHS